MNKKRITKLISFAFITPLLMGFTENDYIHRTQEFDLSITDLGEVGSSYKKYSAVIKNLTNNPIYPNPFEYKNEKYAFVRENEPIQNPVSIVLPKSTCEFFLIVPKEADVINYTYFASAFVEKDTNVEFRGSYNLTYSGELYDECEKVNINCYCDNLNYEYTYTYLVEVAYDNGYYSSMCCPGQYNYLFLYVSKNTVVSDLLVCDISAYKVTHEYAVNYPRKSSGIKVWPLFLLLAVPFIIFMAFAGVIGAIVYTSCNKKKRNKNK